MVLGDAMLPVEDNYVGKETPNFLLKEELEKNNSEGIIRVKLAAAA